MCDYLHNKELFEALRMLRSQLHDCAELANQEERTMLLLTEFLQKHTDFSVVQRPGYLYACKQLDANLPGLAFRAELDAIQDERGQVRHGCGHDGHMAILAGLGVYLSKFPPPDKNIYLLFQPAEETGTGALCVLADGFIEQHHIKEIYGLHNIPGVELGRVICRSGGFACTSKGLTIKLIGSPSHAAYPEFGINPVHAFAAIVSDLKSVLWAGYKGIALYTVVHLQVGQKAFGTMAAEGELSVTLRAEHEEDLQLLEEKIKSLAEKYAAQWGLEYEFGYCDEFPATYNQAACVHKVQQACKQLDITYESMQLPMRWSEDFGYYTKQIPGAFFGLGAGLSCTQLHTSEYEFSDKLLSTGVNVFAKLAQMEL